MKYIYINRIKQISTLLIFSYLLAVPPEFEIVINNNPHPSKMFFSTSSMDITDTTHYFMTILDESLNNYWQINSYQNGRDFKKNYNKLSYYHYNKPYGFDPNENYWIIADQSLQEIDTLKYSFENGILDWHDMTIIDDNHYLFFGYNTYYLDLSPIGGDSSHETGKVLRIVEIDENENIVFNWSALSHMNIYDYTDIPLTNNRFLWMHINSIDIDYDGNLLISNRRSSEIIKINKSTGDVMWIFSGPRNQFLIEGDPFHGVSDQHDVRRLENGNILIFDNGNNHDPTQLRVVEYSLDEVNKTAQLVWKFSNPYNHRAIATGSAQRLPNNNTLINWGTLENQAGADLGANIMEVTQDNEIVLELNFPNNRIYKVRKDNWEFDISLLKGDLSLDNQLNVLDVVSLVNIILSHNSSLSFPMFQLQKVDLNLDSNINVIDIISLIDLIL